MPTRSQQETTVPHWYRRVHKCWNYLSDQIVEDVLMSMLPSNWNVYGKVYLFAISLARNFPFLPKKVISNSFYFP